MDAKRVTSTQKARWRSRHLWLLASGVSAIVLAAVGVQPDGTPADTGSSSPISAREGGPRGQFRRIRADSVSGEDPRPADPDLEAEQRPVPESNVPDLGSDRTNEAVARSFLSIYTNWDPGWVELHMRDGASAVALEELLDWFQNELGPCTEPSSMTPDSALPSRFLYPCERGELEVGFVRNEDDPRRLATVRLGARNVEPPAPVREAALGALALMATWDSQRFRALFSDDFDEEETRTFFSEVLAARGVCTLQEVDLANARGALWFIDCEHGPALMKTDLDDDDRIRLFFVQDRRAARPAP